MKWFRRHIKTGSRLALFALAVQFVLSFGHFHWDAAQAAAGFHGQADLAQAQGIVADAASRAQQRPSGHDDGAPSNEPCAICAVMAMASQMLFATAALLPLPDATEHFFLVTDAGFALPNAPWPAFHSRAPPVS